MRSSPYDAATSQPTWKIRWRVIEAENGVEALERLTQELVDLILLDLMMPVLDGFEFIEKLPGNPDLRHLPAVVLTARILTAEERSFLEQSVAQVVRKGAQDQDKLLEEIAALVHAKQD